MTAIVHARWTVACEACGTRITGIDSADDAEWFADQHNMDNHLTAHDVEAVGQS